MATTLNSFARLGVAGRTVQVAGKAPINPQDVNDYEFVDGEWVVVGGYLKVDGEWVLQVPEDEEPEDEEEEVRPNKALARALAKAKQ